MQHEADGYNYWISKRFFGTPEEIRTPDLLIRSPKKLVTHGQFLPYILSVMFFVVPCCDISYQKV